MTVLDEILVGVRADVATREAAVPFAQVKAAAARRPTAKDALAAGSGNRAASLTGAPRVTEQAGGAVGLDGNNVDVQREMTDLSEAGMQYLVGTQLLQSRLRTLRAAIREGK